MLYKVMVSVVADVTLYAEISAPSREEARALLQAINLDELEGDIDTIREIGTTYVVNLNPNLNPNPNPEMT